MPYHWAAVEPMTWAFTTPKTGTGGRTRTDNLLPEADFESAASTNSATPA